MTVTPSTINDLQFSAPYLSNGGITGTWATINFAPQGPLASTITCNRVDNGVNTRISAGQARLTVFAENGTAWAPSYAYTSDFVQVNQWRPYNAPVLPDPTAVDQTAPMARQSRVRYVRIAAPAVGGFLAIKEVLVLDTAYRNVGYQRSVATTGYMLTGSASHITDGIFDYDTPTLSSASKMMLNTTVGGTAATVTIDLGGCSLHSWPDKAGRGLAHGGLVYYFFTQHRLADAPSASLVHRLLTYILLTTAAGALYNLTAILIFWDRYATPGVSDRASHELPYW